MNALTRFAMCTLVCLGCSKTKDSAGNSPAPQAVESGAPTAAPTPSAPAAPEPASGDEAQKPLAEYLNTAVAATVYAVKLSPGGAGADKSVTKTLDEQATKAYLAKLDLSQRADGPLARCPNDVVVEFADAGGKLLGTIGYCEGQSASFTAPDGTTGGIRATAP